MAIDFNKPTINDVYDTQFVPNIQANVLALGKFLDGETISGLVAGVKRYNAANDLFEEYNGTAWVEMPLGYVKLSTYTAADVLNKLLTVDGAGSGLDADLLDGQHGSYYTDIPARLGYTPLNAASYTAADVLNKLLTVDGAGSGLDADLLDGQHGSYYADIPARLGYTPAPNTRSITAGAGLTGGGNLTADRTISIANNSNGYGVRTVSTSAPSGTPADGDIWIQYE